MMKEEKWEDLCPRLRQERLELERLSPYAAMSARSAGRHRLVQECDVRTIYQRDRDRILHCKSFRRLKHKTQVFLMPDNDHFRTRLTHTLEVSQIARTIARALQLNEDLTEAIALGHDLGHTPFGHAGEDVLNRLLADVGGFSHNEESLRIVEKLENDGQGLNLSYECRDGILHHKRDGTPATLEGKVVSYADRIAYLNHDIDDAQRAGVLTVSAIPAELSLVLGGSHGQRINTMILDIIETSFGQPFVRMSGEIEKAMNDLRDFMFAEVYTNSSAKKEEGKAEHVVEALYRHFWDKPEKLPEDAAARIDEEGRAAVVADYIAMMTDRYAIQLYEDIFVPRTWKNI